MKENTILDIYQAQLEKKTIRKNLLTIVGSRLDSVSYDLNALDDKSSRAAACLQTHGCEKGDRVLISTRETLLIWSFFWGALKLGAVPCVLFPGLGNGGLEVRLKAAEACFFVTDIHPSKLINDIKYPDRLKRIIIADNKLSPVPTEGFEIVPEHLRLHFSSGPEDKSLFALYKEEKYQPIYHTDAVMPDDDAFIVFTSGTTGTPKPVVHRHGIADAIVSSMKNVLHAVPEDVYWCTAHPAWITGTVYGILGPMLCSVPSIQYEGNFHAKRWMPILQNQKVSLWYTAPTALRALKREEDSFFKDFDFSSLKQIYSIGEPLSEAVYHWSVRIFSQPVYDTWFQTECGTIRIANQPGAKIIPGWMGKAVSDCSAEITLPNPDGIGSLVLKSGFSSMFKEYYNMPEETSQKISDSFYQTGDLASQNEEGYFHFEGRADDVINTSGHLVSPMEIEQVLNEHTDVVSAAVIAEPDELLYEAPAAFIVLKEGKQWNRQLETALKVSVNNSVSPYAVPKHFYITENIPQTPSGKISRSELKEILNSML